MTNYTGDGIGLHLEDGPTYKAPTLAAKMFYQLNNLLKGSASITISAFEINRIILDTEVNIRVNILDQDDYFDLNKVGSDIQFYSERNRDLKISIEAASELIQNITNQYYE